MTIGRSSYTAGHFELELDGHKPTTAYLKSVEGGWQRANVVDEPIGGNNNRVKHISTVEVEPFSVEFGLTGSNDILQWIQGSWKRDWGRRNGAITHANFDLRETYLHEFSDALITETTFPTLDAASKDSGYFKFKFLPERVFTKTLSGNGDRVQGRTGMEGRQKLWTPAAFRFNIDSIDDMKYTSKLESFTIKQTVKKMYVGGDRFPQIEPTGIQFPNLTGTISLRYADKLLAWHREYIQSGSQDRPSQKSGSIEFLSPDRKTTIFRINLYEMGIHFAGVEPSTAHADAIKRVKFELYVHRMELDGSGGMAFD